jgi:transmembrane sensor
MTREEYISLYEKYMNGTCTPAEEKLLAEYTDDFKLLDLPWDEETLGDKNETAEFIHNKLLNSIHGRSRRVITLKIIKLTVAATLIVALGIGLSQLKSNLNNPIVKSTGQLRLNNDIRPGGNRAILTLADGSTIVLDSARNGILAKQDNADIHKTKNGAIYYQAGGAKDNTQHQLTNTITTPRGGQYQLTLPDGTNVWLNASSSLTFPVAFTQTERKVQLEGEAYFEVAKDKTKPFLVITRNSEVKVLGTHFNIMTYPDEASTKTTLLEGSVNIRNNISSITLKPGQQAELSDKAGHIKISQANTEEAVAWRSGYFMFNNEDIKSVMRKISRWYDVDVIYACDTSGKDFGGTVSRFKNVSDVLRMLELTGTVHFKVDGRRIIVMP